MSHSLQAVDKLFTLILKLETEICIALLTSACMNLDFLINQPVQALVFFISTLTTLIENSNEPVFILI
jgi:hypothetical protein